MSRDDLKGWIEALWPIVGGLVLVGIAYATLGSRLSSAEEDVRDLKPRVRASEDTSAWLKSALRTGRDPDTGQQFPWAK